MLAIDEAHIARQIAFSLTKFGPPSPQRQLGVLAHIRKELVEIEDTPLDLEEWVDVLILAIDGAWRAGYSPKEIIAGVIAKQEKNERRNWPDWRSAPAGQAIEHIRD